MSPVNEIDQMATLPAVAPTGFPVSYEEARQAIAKCESPFECRTMADQAAAMAIYARMRDDTDLQNRAVRLQAWAARRWGEIDRALHPDRRLENLKQNMAAPPNCGRPQLGDSQPAAGRRPLPPDGTTEYQRVVSRRLATIPEHKFAQQVESPNPPTLTALAAQGKSASASKSPWAEIESVDTRDACETLARFSDFCERTEPSAICRTVGAAEAETLRVFIATAGRWIERVAAGLAEDW